MTDEQIDELSIVGIECYAHHGVFDFEKRDGQTVRDRSLAGRRDRRQQRPRTTCATPLTTEVSSDR